MLSRVLAERQAGRSLRVIASRLTADAIPTARGAAVWQVSAVAGVLKSVALDEEAAVAAAEALQGKGSLRAPTVAEPWSSERPRNGKVSL